MEEKIGNKNAVVYTARDLADIAHFFERRGQSEAMTAHRMDTVKDKRFYEGSAASYRDAAKILRATKLRVDGPMAASAAEFGFNAHGRGESLFGMLDGLGAFLKEKLELGEKDSAKIEQLEAALKMATEENKRLHAAATARGGKRGR